MLDEVILSCSHDFLIINKFSKQNCILVYDWIRRLLSVLLLPILAGKLSSRHWFEYLEPRNQVNHKVRFEALEGRVFRRMSLTSFEELRRGLAVVVALTLVCLPLCLILDLA